MSVWETGSKNPCRYIPWANNNALVGNIVGVSDGVMVEVGALVGVIGFVALDTDTLNRIVGAVGAVPPLDDGGGATKGAESSSPFTK